MTLTGRLVAGTVAVSLLCIALLTWFGHDRLRRDLERDLFRQMEQEAMLLAQVLAADSAGGAARAREVATRSGRRLTLVSSEGRLIFDSEVAATQLSSLENHRSRPEIATALGGGVGRARRRSITLGVPMLYVAVPFSQGAVRVADTPDTVAPLVQAALRRAALGGVAVLAAAALAAFLAGRVLTTHLGALEQAAAGVAEGETPRFPHSTVPEIERIVGSLRDVHSRVGLRLERLRREQSDTTAIIDAMAEGVIAADQRGRVLHANASARRLLGYSETERLPDLTQLFRAKAARGVVDAALRGATVTGRELDADGQALSLSARPLPGGGLVLVIRNVTEIRRLEAVRRDFVANVSHELKTPLTSISGYSETLLTDRPDRETSDRFLKVIMVNARRMQRLVDSLLDLSRIESGRWQPQLEEFELGPVVNGVLEDCRTRAATRAIGFEVDLDPAASRLVADEEAVRHVVLNLVDNAVRYTPEGGRITVRSRPEDGGIQLSVADTGIGITREHLPRIFERFYRADPSRSREEGGTGLGLAIVKHLVEAHGGRVTAESEWGKGTTVRCHFPALPEPESIASRA